MYKAARTYASGIKSGHLEVTESQVFITGNGKDDLLESMKVEGSSDCPTASTEKAKEDSAPMKGLQQKVESTALEDTGKKTESAIPKDSRKKAKSHSLMQEVTDFLTSRYRFRFNVLTEETEVADAESGIPDSHLRYAKVDEGWMNSLSLEAIETGIDCWDSPPNGCNSTRITTVPIAWSFLLVSDRQGLGKSTFCRLL